MQRFIPAVLTVLTLAIGSAIRVNPALAQETNTVVYRCDEGKGFKAVYTTGDNSSVEATFGTRVFTLPQVKAASGARYSDGSVTIHTKGDEAFVEVGNTVLFRNCVAQSGAVSGLW
jgi:membrane-bound inhibitor of C-type lysozyme